MARRVEGRLQGLQLPEVEVRLAVDTMIVTVSAYALLFGRITLGLVFALSGVTKLAEWTRFATAVREFRILPGRAVVPVALGITMAELVLAAALLIGIAVEMAVGTAVLLLAAFTAALVHALRRGQQVVCRCFGELSDRPVSWAAVFRNGLLIGLALVTWRSAVGSGQSIVPTADAVVVALLAFSAVAVFGLVNEASVLIREAPRTSHVDPGAGARNAIARTPPL